MGSALLQTSLLDRSNLWTVRDTSNSTSIVGKTHEQVLDTHIACVWREKLHSCSTLASQHLVLATDTAALLEQPLQGSKQQ